MRQDHLGGVSVERGALPETVRRPDGRLEPFEPERISRSLFAATERLGRPDAFLARELTDGVLHFFAATEDIGPGTTPDRIAEVVGKVVRELGHPALARAYEHDAAEAPPASGTVRATEAKPAWPQPVDPARAPAAIERDLGRGQLRSSALQIAFPRDLASAHAEGLIELEGLEHPFEVGGVVAAVPPRGVLEAIHSARRLAGGFIAIDGPEYDLASFPDDPATLAGEYLREAQFAADALGVTLVLNLNCRTPPARLAEASGPLFAGIGPAAAGHRRAIAVALADQARNEHLSVWWHVAADPARADESIETVCELVTADRRVEFVFDRPRSPVALGPGVDRATPAALVRVRLNLERLVELAGGTAAEPDVFLRKVGSLARFAKTAGHVKQDFLRRHGRDGLREAFLLDRARLVFGPTGLIAAARSCDQPPVDFGRDVLRTIRAAAENDRPRLMPVCVEAILGRDDEISTTGVMTTVRQRLRTASAWHAITAAGRCDLTFANGQLPPIPELAEAVWVGADSATARMTFVGP